ncbi:hypothetical protein L596_026366 [Steinernema carpocapsae]|uniref:Uncharacterized protein n=1 Tax=Steinernema carpocapsae TaxID=34508 RepID=A0A4U5M192_STECR|nr:hypothetical protein L596_026366 [Steinernema carpocapsae]
MSDCVSMLAMTTYFSGDALRHAGFIEVFEGVEEIGESAFVVPRAEEHLSAALFDGSHDHRVWHGALDLHELLVGLLQVLELLQLREHLDLKRVDLISCVPFFWSSSPSLV